MCCCVVGVCAGLGGWVRGRGGWLMSATCVPWDVPCGTTGLVQNTATPVFPYICPHEPGPWPVLGQGGYDMRCAPACRSRAPSGTECVKYSEGDVVWGHSRGLGHGGDGRCCWWSIHENPRQPSRRDQRAARRHGAAAGADGAGGHCSGTRCQTLRLREAGRWCPRPRMSRQGRPPPCSSHHRRPKA